MKCQSKVVHFVVVLFQLLEIKMEKYVNSILMIRPSSFRKNIQTSKNNFFQKKIKPEKKQNILEQSIKEFDRLVSKLINCGFKVYTFQDDLKNDTPDSIFPNNWITFHHNKTIALFPMYAKNRRLERDQRVLEFLESKNLIFNEIYNYSEAENDGIFLEGTGSMVLDRINKKAYCSLSERTDCGLLIEFCEDFKYIPIIFNSYHNVNMKRKPIYHTNIMMCMAIKYCIICLNSIDCNEEKKSIINSLTDDKKEIIEISEYQLELFAGNMIELINEKGSFLFMSESAYKALDKNQINKISKYSNIIYSPVSTIESFGGGSVRCMIAEIFN